MFFLTNVFERRLNDNMRRHALDAKIASSRPKPSSRVTPRRASMAAMVSPPSTPASVKSGDVQLLDCFLASADSQRSLVSLSTLDEAATAPLVAATDAPALLQLDEAVAVVGDVLANANVHAVTTAADIVKASVVDVKKPLDVCARAPFARRGSVESAAFTDSDAASNFSCAA